MNENVPIIEYGYDSSIIQLSFSQCSACIIDHMQPILLPLAKNDSNCMITYITHQLER